MTEPSLRDVLRAIGVRDRWHRALGTALRAWSLAGLICLGAAGVLVGAGIAAPSFAWAALPVVAAFGCFALHRLRPWNPERAARLADRGGALADRAVTAWEWRDRAADPWGRLQGRDALRCLAELDARTVVRWRAPRGAWLGPAGSVALAALVFLPVARFAVAEPPRVADAALRAAREELARDVLPEIERLIEQHPDPQLEQLVQEWRETLAALARPETEPREALVALSSLQEELARALSSARGESSAEGLAVLGKALEDVGVARPAARALRAGRFGEAAAALERLAGEPTETSVDPAELAPLESARDALERAGEERLARAAEDWKDALERRSAEDLRASMRELATLARQQETRDLIASNLRAAHGALGAAKGKIAEAGRCLACGAPLASERHFGFCKPCSEKLRPCARCENGQPCAGGGCAGGALGAGAGAGAGAAGAEARSEALAKVLSQLESRNPSLQAGSGVHGGLSDPTAIDGGRRLERIQGILGAGPSETEITSSPRGEGRTTRTHREVYERYRKESEAVLEAEAIPLSRRAMIRRYFELIRPEGTDGR